MTRPVYDSRYLLTQAIMTEKPLVFVEGGDDVPIYQKMCNLANSQIDLQPIDNLFKSGLACGNVISIVQELEGLSASNKREQAFFLGIVDGDAQQYWRTPQVFNHLFRLKYYSIESYFLSSPNINGLISKTTKQKTPLDKKSLKFIYGTLHLSIKDDLYYPALSALYKSCTPNSTTKFNYGMETKDYQNQQNTNPLNATEKAMLDSFATTKNITYNWENLLRICKGKWILDYFVNKYVETMRNLKDYCINNQIMQCTYGRNDRHNEKCLYKPNLNYQFNNIKVLLRDEPPRNLNCLQNRLRQLGKG